MSQQTTTEVRKGERCPNCLCRYDSRPAGWSCSVCNPNAAKVAPSPVTPVVVAEERGGDQPNPTCGKLAADCPAYAAEHPRHVDAPTEQQPNPRPITDAQRAAYDRLMVAWYELAELLGPPDATEAELITEQMRDSAGDEDLITPLDLFELRDNWEADCD